jgi:hypothetical protein
MSFGVRLVPHKKFALWMLLALEAVIVLIPLTFCLSIASPWLSWQQGGLGIKDWGLNFGAEVKYFIVLLPCHLQITFF